MRRKIIGNPRNSPKEGFRRLPIAALLLMIALVCGITTGCENRFYLPPNSPLIREDAAQSAEELDSAVALITADRLESARVRIASLDVWDSLNDYYAENRDILFMRGIEGLEIRYTLGGQETRYIEVEIVPRYEMYVRIMIADSGREIALDEREQAVYNKARSIIRTELGGAATDFDRAYALQRWLVDNIEYDNEHAANDDAFNVYGALISGRAVCQGYAQAYKLLLEMIGVESLLISGEAGGVGHAWNLVNYGSGGSASFPEWYHVDVTWNDRDNRDGGSNKFFNVDDGILAFSHKWERENYPAAVNTRLNYFRYKGLVAQSPAELESLFASMFAGVTPFYREMITTFDVTDEELRFIGQYAAGGSVSYSTAIYGADMLLTIVIA